MSNIHSVSLMIQIVNLQLQSHWPIIPLAISDNTQLRRKGIQIILWISWQF